MVTFKKCHDLTWHLYVFSRYKVYNFSYLHHSNQFGIWNVPSDKVCENLEIGRILLPAQPRPTPKQKRLPRASLHLTSSQSSSYRANYEVSQHWYFCWLSDFHFHSSLNIGFLWSPHRLSRTEAFQCTTSAGWLFLQILYKKSSKRKLLFNFCSPRRRCNKNKIGWNNMVCDHGGQPSKTIKNTMVGGPNFQNFDHCSSLE